MAGATVVLAGVLPLAVAGCGPTTSAAGSGASASSGVAASSGSSASSSVGCQQVGSVTFDKTKFVLHAGLAFGAFHHFIYNRFKSGSFASGASGRVKNLVEAGLAGLFTVHELKLVKQDAESSPTLCHLVAPLDQAGAELSALEGKLKSGSLTSQDVEGVNGKIGAAQQGASSAGVPAPDQVPSAAQLAGSGS